MSMTKREIDTAIAEARRFIARAEDALKREREDTHYLVAEDGTWYRGKYVDGIIPDEAHVQCTRESGALKRASLDLTRTLADLRRS